MSVAPILLAGGSGLVGRRTAQYLREASPETPLLIGGRDVARARDVAAGLGPAEGVAIDLEAPDLGLGRRALSAVAVLVKDDRLATLRFAQARGLPHLSISSGASEIGPEVAAFVHRPQAAAVVLGAEWLVGATTIPTLEFASMFSRVDEIRIGALLDEEDTGGPAAAVDMQRLEEILPAALTRKDGAFFWRLGQEAKSRFRAVDGTEMEAVALSPFDVMGLAMATDAPNVRFDIAGGVSSTRRRGQPMSTEIIIELSGRDHAGGSLRVRRAIVHPEGQMPLTALGVAMILERLAGLSGPPVAPGLYFPYQLLERSTYLARLRQVGGSIVELDAA